MELESLVKHPFRNSSQHFDRFRSIPFLSSPCVFRFFKAIIFDHRTFLTELNNREMFISFHNNWPTVCLLRYQCDRFLNETRKEMCRMRIKTALQQKNRIDKEWKRIWNLKEKSRHLGVYNVKCTSYPTSHRVYLRNRIVHTNGFSAAVSTF